MRIRITSMLAAGLLCLPVAVPAADTLPTHGMTKSSVRSQYGAPQKEVAPIGKPPISRWVYEDFTVYFEGNHALHSVRHSRTLTTPPATATHDDLPEMEELGTPDQPGATVAPVAPSEAPAPVAEESTPAAEPEGSFRFDPVTGRIIEIGPDGKPIKAPTAQPGAQTAPATPQPAPAAPAEETQPVEAPAAPLTPAPEPQADVRFDPVTGKFVEVGPAAEPAAEENKPAPAPAAPTPAPEPAPAPVPAPVPTPVPAPAPAPKAQPAPPPAPTETAPEASAPASGQPQFRFDPATGRIVVDDGQAPAAPAPAPSEPPAVKAAPAKPPADKEPAATEEATPPAEETREQSRDEAEEQSDEEGGYSVDWSEY